MNALDYDVGEALRGAPQQAMFICPECGEPGYHGTTQQCIESLDVQIKIEQRRLTPPKPAAPRPRATDTWRAAADRCPHCGAALLAPEPDPPAVLMEKERLRLVARHHWQKAEQRRLAADARRLARKSRRES